MSKISLFMFILTLQIVEWEYYLSICLLVDLCVFVYRGDLIQEGVKEGEASCLHTWLTVCVNKSRAVNWLRLNNRKPGENESLTSQQAETEVCVCLQLREKQLVDNDSWQFLTHPCLIDTSSGLYHISLPQTTLTRTHSHRIHSFTIITGVKFTFIKLC